MTATWALVHPDRPVTIGVPLPTYSVVILDPTEDQALPLGEVGEIGLAGIGLARGYLNRDDLTVRASFKTSSESPTIRRAESTAPETLVGSTRTMRSNITADWILRSRSGATALS